MILLYRGIKLSHNDVRIQNDKNMSTDESENCTVCHVIEISGFFVSLAKNYTVLVTEKCVLLFNLFEFFIGVLLRFFWYFEIVKRCKILKLFVKPRYTF